MAKQLGRSLLLKISDGASPDVYTAFAGLNSKSLTINNSSIDVTTPDATTPGGALWAESLDGLKAVSVSGDGIFLDETDEEGRLNTVAMLADSTSNFQILVPGFGTYTGSFRVASFDFGGESEGAVTFSTSLESNGAIVFAAV
tara:strand:+ start:8877 stop:9305 length:429 start_codon:yes stop_codon:yes gene_type:complete